MKKFKDFLYDKNDILIALLILVAAALLIIWRMEAIMEYPKTLLSDDTVAEERLLTKACSPAKLPEKKAAISPKAKTAARPLKLPELCGQTAL